MIVKDIYFKYSVTVIHQVGKGLRAWKQKGGRIHLRSLVFFIPVGAMFSPACQAQHSIKISFFSGCLGFPPKCVAQHFRDEVFNGSHQCEGGQGQIAHLIYVCGLSGCRCAYIGAECAITVLLQTLMATLETGAVHGSEMKPDLCWKKIYVHVSESSFWAKKLITTTCLSWLTGEKLSPRREIKCLCGQMHFTRKLVLLFSQFYWYSCSEMHRQQRHSRS